MINRNSFRIAAWALFLVLLAVTAYFAFSRARYVALNNPFEGQATPNADSAAGGSSGENGDSSPGTDGGTAQPGEGIEAGDGIPDSQWAGSSRVTILVMGLDLRDWEVGDSAPRTDTMILLTLDPLSKTAGMLSIPRDLWVEIPGFGYDRINTAYRNGEVFDLPGGGPALATETVEKLVGVEIDYFAQVDFNVFVRMIDEIGGVKIEITEPIKVDLIGPEPPKVIQPGTHTLPGDVALAYARARGTEGGDFDRAQRQQQVILAIRNQLLRPDLVPLLLTKSGTLYIELSSGVRTNLPLEGAIDLGLLAIDIPVESIRRGVIGSDEINFYTTPDGDQVLKPLPDQVRSVRDYVFGTTGLSSPLAELTPEARLQAESATIALKNGTLREGLAGATADFLSEKGFAFLAENVGNANQTFPFTQVIDYTGNPYTVQMLVEQLGIQSHLIYLRYDPNSPIDVEVNLGNDWSASFTP
jgi:LCP family protein required for cell wall assembly